MRLLFLLTESPYPADNGTRIISYNVIRLMRASGHQCALVIIGSSSDEDKMTLAGFCREYSVENLGEYPLPSHNAKLTALYSVVSHTPFFVNRYFSKTLDVTIQSLINHWKPDAVHYDTICLTKFSRPIKSGTKAIASVNDSYTLTLKNEIWNSHLSFWRILYKRYQYYIVKRHERRAYNRFDSIHVVSQTDADSLKEIGIKTDIAVIPNGVSHEISPQNISANPPDLIFVAKLGNDNLTALSQFLYKAWPDIKAANPGIRLRIVGRKTPASQQLEKSLNDAQVEFLGFIADLNTAYKLGRISLVPINKNCGIINKAVEAMAAGLVVVGFEACFTALTEARNGEHYLAGKTFQELTAHINRILKSPDQATRIGAAAQQVASNFYSWETRSQAFKNLYSHSKPENNPILVTA